MPAAIDMDYCMIVIEKLINPLTPMEQIMPLLRDLMDSVPHPEMKKLAQSIVDPDLDQGEKRKLMNEFKHYDHGGANDFSEVNYNELIDKFLDPNLPDHEYKPTMKALLEGDLDQERKNQVVNIINCHDKEQKANMVKRFKSSFEKDKEEKEQAEKERAAAKLAKQKEKENKENELKVNLLEFSDDGMILVMRMLDKKIPREKKTDIYDRLMEPDVDAEIKNLAIQMISLTKNTERIQCVEDFKKKREDEKRAEEKRKKDEEQRKIEEENARKEMKMRRKEELLGKKKKDERMKKRELTIKMRADERRRETQSVLVGPSSVQEREEARRKERDRVKEEMRRFKEQSLKDMKRAEREDMRKAGWMVLPCDGNLNMDIQVVVPDLNYNLSDNERMGFDKALAKLKESLAERRPSQDASGERRPSQDASGERRPSQDASGERRNNQDKSLPGEPKIISKELRESKNTKETKPASSYPKDSPDVDSVEFEKYFGIFSNPSLTESEEVNHIKKLIKENKSPLIKMLVLKLDSVPGVGKSVIFKALSKKFVKKNAAPPVQKSDMPKKSEGDLKKAEQDSKANNVESKQDAVMLKKSSEEIKSVNGEGKETSEVNSSGSVENKSSIEYAQKPTATESNKNNGVEGTKSEVEIACRDNGESIKRPPSDESDFEIEPKKAKLDKISGENEESEQRKRKRSGEDSGSGEKKKKKKKKHRHKDDKHSDDKDLCKSKKVIKSDKDEIAQDLTLKDDSNKKEKNEDDVIDGSEVKDQHTLPKPVLDMSFAEIRKEFKLKKIESYVRVKNLKKLYKVYLKQEEIRNKKWEEEMKLEREAEEKERELSKGSETKCSSSNSNKEADLNSKSRSSSPGRSRSNSGRPKSRSSSKFKRKSRSPSTKTSKSPTRSRSPSVKSNTKSPSRSKIPISRSPSTSKHRSKSPSKAKSLSRSRSKSISGSRSRSRSKSISRSRSKSISRSKTLSRSKSRSMSRSRSRSKSRSGAVSRSPSAVLKSRSVSRSRSKSVSR